MMKLQNCCLLLLAFIIHPSFGQNNLPLSRQMAATAMRMWKDSLVVGSSKDGRARWVYQESVYLQGLEELYNTTGDEKYYAFIKKHVDYYVNADGSIRTYKYSDMSIDNIPMGRIVLMLYKKTGEEKYKKAIETLNRQMEEMPRTHEGSIWHKGIYPWQVWLDGLYMGQPFYAEYTKVFRRNDTIYNDIINQFTRIENHTREPKTGLLYHGWDESKGMKWANDVTGCSPQFWSRAMGWYAMALADVPEFLPENHPGRKKLSEIFIRLADAVQKVQDPKTGVWYQILDSIGVPGNYPESSGSCMFVYAIAKGVRLGYLPTSYLAIAKKGYEGIKQQFIETDAGGQVNLKLTCRGAGLGNNPYRDGSFKYYISEPVITNDAHGIGSFILAANEMEKVQ